MWNMTKRKKVEPDVANLDRDDRLSFRCPAVLKQAIENCARRDRRSVSDWIVIALNHAVNQADEDQNQRDGY
jgi:hypothetical protein